MSTEPLTEAGRSLFARLWAVNDYSTASRIIAGVQGDIIAIEQEAALTAVTPLRHAARAAQDENWVPSQEPITRTRAAQDVAGRERMTFGPECGPFDHPVGCQCPYPLVAAERDRIAALLVTPPPDALRLATAFIHIRGAHNPTADELDGEQEVRPCAWCRLAGEQAAEALAALRAQGVVPSPVRVLDCGCTVDDNQLLMTGRDCEDPRHQR